VLSAANWKIAGWCQPWQASEKEEDKGEEDEEKEEEKEEEEEGGGGGGGGIAWDALLFNGNKQQAAHLRAIGAKPDLLLGFVSEPCIASEQRTEKEWLCLSALFTEKPGFKLHQASLCCMPLKSIGKGGNIAQGMGCMEAYWLASPQALCLGSFWAAVSCPLPWSTHPGPPAHTRSLSRSLPDSECLGQTPLCNTARRHGLHTLCFRFHKPDGTMHSTCGCLLHSAEDMPGLCTLYSSKAGWCKMRNKRTDGAFRHVDVEKLEVCSSSASASWAFGWCEEKQRKETKEQKIKKTTMPSGNVMKSSLRMAQVSLLIQPKSPDEHVTGQSRVHEHVP